MKTKWNDGTTHLVFEKLEPLEKIAALIPRPQINLVIYPDMYCEGSQICCEPA